MSLKKESNSMSEPPTDPLPPLRQIPPAAPCPRARRLKMSLTDANDETLFLSPGRLEALQ